VTNGAQYSHSPMWEWRTANTAC